MLDFRPWRVVAVAALVTASMLSFGSEVSARQAPGASLPADDAVSAPLPPGVISWWRGEGNANDAIGSNHGALMNGASFAPGLVGTAFQFDGINDVVSIPDAPSLQLNLLSPRTIEAWAFRTTSTSPVHLVGHRVGCGGGIDFYQMAIGANAHPSNSVPLNVWSHVALTYDGLVQRQYVNGVLVFAVTVAFPSTSPAAPFLIGGSGTCATFAGRLDEVTLYNRALSQQEIQGIVAAGPDGKAAASSLLPPTGLQASVSGSNVLLTWTAAASASLYRLRVGFAPGASSAFDGLVGNVTLLNAAAPPGTYFARVHAVDAGLESGPSNEVRIDVGTSGGCVPAPAAPATLTANITGTVVRLAWGGAANAASYVIEAGSGAAQANLVSFDTGNASLSFTANAPAGAYFVRVRGKNACGVGPASNEVLVLVTGS